MSRATPDLTQGLTGASLPKTGSQKMARVLRKSFFKGTKY